MKVRVGCKGLICATCGAVLVSKQTTTMPYINAAVENHRKTAAARQRGLR